MIKLPVNETEIEIINKANGNNIIAVPCWDADLNSAYIEDNWGDPVWKSWWEKYHQLGGTYHAGEVWPSEENTSTTTSTTSAE